MVIQLEWLGLITAVIAAVLTVIGQIILFSLNKRSQREIEEFKKQAIKEMELLSLQLRQLEEIDKLRRRYSTPLLKSTEELYNKLNDIIVRNRDRVLGFFEELPVEIDRIGTIGDVLKSRTRIYLTSVLYLFARYFAGVEAIKKDVGLLQLASDEETKAFQLRLKQTVAIFYSGRLHDNIKIRKPDRLKHEGRILEGAQVLIGESMLKKENGSHECISFYEFCQKIAADEDFRQSLSPLLDFLGGLEKVQSINYFEATDVDFRWVKLILFASFLRKLVEQMDSAKVVMLLPELEQYEQEYLTEHSSLQRNIQFFKEAFPDP
jgi:hypothetical protein